MKEVDVDEPELVRKKSPGRRDVSQARWEGKGEWDGGELPISGFKSSDVRHRQVVAKARRRRRLRHRRRRRRSCTGPLGDSGTKVMC